MTNKPSCRLRKASSSVLNLLSCWKWGPPTPPPPPSPAPELPEYTTYRNLMDYGEEGRIYKLAIDLVAPSLASPIATRIRERIIPGNYGFFNAILWSVEAFLTANICETPTSFAHFLTLTEGIFAPSTIEMLRQKAESFDKMAGHTGVSDAFIQQRCAGDWVRHMLRNFAQGCENTAAKRLQLGYYKIRLPTCGICSRQDSQPLSSASASGQVGTESSRIPQSTTCCCTEDISETTDLGGRPPQPPHTPLSSPSPSPTCPIIDIHISGPDLKSAWSANPLLRQLEETAVASSSLGSNLPPCHSGTPPSPHNHDIKPTSAALRPVYHATPRALLHLAPPVAEFQNELLLAACQSFKDELVLRGSVVRNNQVAPAVSEFPVAWTAFSPLRSFLWAAFVNEVLLDVPTTTTTTSPSTKNGQETRLSRGWDCRWSSRICEHGQRHQPDRHQHRGVTLLQFRPFPPPNHISSYVLPVGKEQEWTAIRDSFGTDSGRRGFRLFMAPQTVWTSFSAVHQDALSSWPEALHCREFGPQADMLESSFTPQLWKTAWFGEGIKALNRSPTTVYSISFSVAEGKTEM